MLLIRSQDKRNYANIETVKCLSISESDKSITADYGDDFWITLGRYKTIGRAISNSIGDVINSLNHNCSKEVERGMAGNLIRGVSGYGFVRNGTYDMPEE